MESLERQALKVLRDLLESPESLERLARKGLLGSPALRVRKVRLAPMASLVLLAPQGLRVLLALLIPMIFSSPLIRSLLLTTIPILIPAAR